MSPHAGTTRDVIEVALDLDGYPVTVIDTAGVRETADPVEQEGVRRAKARAAEADLVLWLTDAQNPLEPPAAAVPVWMVRNKVDLDAPGSGKGTAQRPEKMMADFRISARRGDGLAQLIAALVGFAEAFFGSGEGGLITRTRQRQWLQDAAGSLQRSLVGEGEELVAEELRAAAFSLGRLLGRVDVEDILDVIFREFCVGK